MLVVVLLIGVIYRFLKAGKRGREGGRKGGFGGFGFLVSSLLRGFLCAVEVVG